MLVRKAIIPAAGVGRRYYSATRAHSKETMPVGNRPAIHYSIKELYESGISSVLIITNEYKPSIENYFDVCFAPNAPLSLEDKNVMNEIEEINSKVFISYARQKRFKGPANALYEAKDFVNGEPFAVILPDDLIFYKNCPPTKDIIGAFDVHDKSIVGVKYMKGKPCQSEVLGTRKVDDFLFEIDSLKKASSECKSDIGTVGRYVLKPDFFDAILETIPTPEGEYTMTNVINTMTSSKGVYGKIIDGEWFDVGKPLEHIKAQIHWAALEPQYMNDIKSYLRGKLEELGGQT
jgi:UTP--glucose-1-phosphate uridylyltransferase